MIDTYELPKDLLHEVIIRTIEITNLSNRIIRSYFGMELKFGGEEENWRILNADELNNFNYYFLENLGASYRAELLLEIKEELKECSNFRNKLIDFYKLRNKFAHKLYPEGLDGRSKIWDSSAPDWKALNEQHKALYEELKEFFESAIKKKDISV